MKIATLILWGQRNLQGLQAFDHCLLALCGALAAFDISLWPAVGRFFLILDSLENVENILK